MLSNFDLSYFFGSSLLNNILTGKKISDSLLYIYTFLLSKIKILKKKKSLSYICNLRINLKSISFIIFLINHACFLYHTCMYACLQTFSSTFWPLHYNQIITPFEFCILTKIIVETKLLIKPMENFLKGIEHCLYP